MSEFSTVLSRFVKEKDVNVYRLAKYCGYDRANLYKVMRGERKPPSLEVLNLLCEYNASFTGGGRNFRRKL